MLDKLGVNTDSFYKYTTTLSFIGIVYFFSFVDLHLKPFNDYITETNLTKAKLASDYGYIRGVSEDLTALVKDSIKNGYLEYFYENKDNRSDEIAYYSTLSLKPATKKLVDSLNLVNRQMAEYHFKGKAISDTTAVLMHNLNVKRVLSAIFAGISMLIFSFSLFKWHKIRAQIDK